MATRNGSKDATKYPSGRGNWSGNLEALLSYIGYCVGLGNIWRFPYLCYRNGGGAFLIPYFLMMLMAGLPLFFMELAMGQFSSMSASTVWVISPLFKGVGWCAVMTSALCCIYYNQIIAYILYYLYSSLTSELPWTTCDNDWNTPKCMVMRHSVNYNITNGTQLEMLTLNRSSFNISSLPHKSPGEEYWERHVLNKSSGLGEFGGLEWKLTLALALAWVLVFFCLIKGIKSTGKVVYVTATFPYLVLTILLVRGLTLPGASDGIMFYLVPSFSKLADAKVWGDAASQIFYSLGPAWGILITYSSYNKFNHNSHRDAIITTFMCTGTSVFAGLVIFSVIGFMAHELNVEIEDVMSSGPGLVFVVYPEAISRMPLAPLWAIMFFLMMLSIALDSMFAIFETVVTALADEYPQYLMKRKTLFTAFLCVLFFFLGLPQSSQAGIYILTMMDWYIGTFPPLITSFCEVIVISYVYGYSHFAADIRSMMGFSPNLYWKVTWMGLAPAAILFIVVFNAVMHEPVSLGDYRYPWWGEAIGWMFCSASLICIPLFMVVAFWQKTGGFGNLVETLKFPWTGETLKLLTQAEPGWAPAHVRDSRNIPNIPYNGVAQTDKEFTEMNDNISEKNHLNV